MFSIFAEICSVIVKYVFGYRFRNSNYNLKGVYSDECFFCNFDSRYCCVATLFPSKQKPKCKVEFKLKKLDSLPQYVNEAKCWRTGKSASVLDGHRGAKINDNNYITRLKMFS